MLCFGPGNFVYKCTNQRSMYTNGTFYLKSPNVLNELFYISITVKRFTVYNLIVLYLCLGPPYKQNEEKYKFHIWSFGYKNREKRVCGVHI